MYYYLTDGHHKLVRWRFVTHSAIDGYSRLVLFIKCSNNNRASTVYDSFLPAVQQYGLPSRVRCDQGGENILVAQHMIHHRGSERSVLVGSSVHNQRIERLWRDMHRCVTTMFYRLFYCLEHHNTVALEVAISVLRTCLSGMGLQSLRNQSQSLGNGSRPRRITTPRELLGTSFSNSLSGTIPQEQSLRNSPSGGVPQEQPLRNSLSGTGSRSQRRLLIRASYLKVFARATVGLEMETPFVVICIVLILLLPACYALHRDNPGVDREYLLDISILFK